MKPINREGTSYPSTGVLVFSKETGCTQCVLTKRILLEEGIDHTIILVLRAIDVDDSVIDSFFN